MRETSLNISLIQYLRTGIFSPLKWGMSVEQVSHILGRPDVTGSTSRQFSRPSILLYGTVELWFSNESPQRLIGIFWDAQEKGDFRFAGDTVVLDWGLYPFMPQKEVETVLRENGITLMEGEYSPVNSNFTLPVGIKITFDDNGRLYSIYSGESP